MIITALNRTWSQLLDPTFRRVLALSLAVAALTFAGVVVLADLFWPASLTMEADWLPQWVADLGFWAVVAVAAWFLFPAMVTLVMGFMLERVADAVEARYYPNRQGARDPGWIDPAISALKLLGLVLLLNLLALIPYVILLALTGGVGTLALYLVLNGILLGREYFELVTLRHMRERDMVALRRRGRDRVFMGGVVIAGLFLIPVVNLVAPIIATAVMTHLVHDLFHREAGR
ncbi:EI24 domain-containing protein [Yunchengibacter salinarum]|uniref:EI24 domain-containing protein n=1 Tax=Yunchengibacter salinarum TaxID=3133399 RepID=UPI0035B6A918